MTGHQCNSCACGDYNIYTCVYLITGEMKDLFRGSLAIQQMEKFGPGNNCWTVSKVVDEIVTG